MYDLRMEGNLLSTGFSKALSFLFERMKTSKGHGAQAIHRQCNLTECFDELET
jgi:hypothetical protein